MIWVFSLYDVLFWVQVMSAYRPHNSAYLSRRDEEMSAVSSFFSGSLESVPLLPPSREGVGSCPPRPATLVSSSSSISRPGGGKHSESSKVLLRAPVPPGRLTKHGHTPRDVVPQTALASLRQPIGGNLLLKATQRRHSRRCGDQPALPTIELSHQKPVVHKAQTARQVSGRSFEQSLTKFVFNEDRSGLISNQRRLYATLGSTSRENEHVVPRPTLEAKRKEIDKILSQRDEHLSAVAKCIHRHRAKSFKDPDFDGFNRDKFILCVDRHIGDDEFVPVRHHNTFRSNYREIMLNFIKGPTQDSLYLHRSASSVAHMNKEEEAEEEAMVEEKRKLYATFARKCLKPSLQPEERRVSLMSSGMDSEEEPCGEENLAVSIVEPTTVV